MTSMTEQIAAWGYEPEPGEAPDTGTLGVHDGSDRWIITYDASGPEVVVELVDRSTDPADTGWSWRGMIGDLRPFIQAAYRKASEENGKVNL